MSINDETLRQAAAVRARIGAEVDAETRRLVAAWVRAYNQLRPELAAALDELADLRADGRWPTRAQISRATRARQALAVAREALDELSADARIGIVDAMGRAVDLAVTAEPGIIGSQLPADGRSATQIATAFDRVDAAAIQAIVRRSTQQITALTRPLSRQAANVMRQELVRAVPVGTNPREAAARILRRMEGGFNGGLTRALVITRTEILDASRAGAQAQQDANADVLAGWTWAAQLDSRTCPSCWAQHGTEHPLSEAGPLDHQQGRCARLPRAKTWRELGIDLDEPPSVLPDAQARFQELPETDQLAVMGRARLDALAAGTVTWGDLSRRRSTTGWRDSFAPTPVRDLVSA